ILGDGSVYERTGVVSFSDRQVNPSTGAIRLAGVFPNPGGLLRPGEFGRVRFAPKSVEGALLVPQRAVTELQGSHQVAVLGEGNKVRIRPVTVGERVGNLWIVTNGLKPGERVVVEGVMKVKEGAVVKPIEAGSARAGA